MILPWMYICPFYLDELDRSHMDRFRRTFFWENVVLQNCSSPCFKTVSICASKNLPTVLYFWGKHRSAFSREQHNHASRWSTSMLHFLVKHSCAFVRGAQLCFTFRGSTKAQLCFLVEAQLCFTLGKAQLYFHARSTTLLHTEAQLRFTRKHTSASLLGKSIEE